MTATVAERAARIALMTVACAVYGVLAYAAWLALLLITLRWQVESLTGLG